MNDNNDGKKNKNKEEWNKKYAFIAIYSFIVIMASFAVIIIILGVRDFFIEQQYVKILNILTPIIYGFVFAYILNPLLTFFQNKIFFKIRKNIKNVFSILATYLATLIIITLLLLMVIPQIVDSVQQLTGKAADLLSPHETFTESKGEEKRENIENDKVEIEPETETETTNIDETDGGNETDLEAISDIDIANSKLGVFINDLGESIQGYIDSMGLKVDVVETFSNMTDNIINLLSSYIMTAVNGIISVVYGVFSSVLNIILGILLSVYLLVSKDKFIAQTKKVFFALFPTKFSFKLVRVMRKTHEIFGGFISGKILESVIVGAICFTVMMIFRLPYAVLITVIVTVTNVIPFFGSIIGGVIGSLFLAINDIRQGLLFAVIILILQQIDGNFIGPKILGSKVGLPAFWVIVSIIVMGGLFNLPGIFVGTPVFAVAYVLIKEFVENKLKNKGFPQETEHYIRNPKIAHIDTSARNTKPKSDESHSNFFGKALDKTAKNIMGIFHKTQKQPEDETKNKSAKKNNDENKTDEPDDTNTNDKQ